MTNSEGLQQIFIHSTCHGSHQILFDQENFELLSIYGWFLVLNGNHLYAKARIQGTKGHIKMHRLLLNAQNGEYVDHVNGNTLDNRKINLRKCSIADNTKNQSLHKDSTSGYKGVSFDNSRHKWRSNIVVDRKQIHLGRFDTAEDAAKAYNLAAKLYFGDFARINKL